MADSHFSTVPPTEAIGASPDDKRQAARVSASQDVRTAQVELYCDHQQGALTAIRRAKRALEDAGSPSDFVDLATLEEATYHARKNDVVTAVDLLTHAKEHIDR
jgi:hypothetical protein